MYALTTGDFVTPRGTRVTLAYREDTNDFNTLRSCLDEDEYGLRGLRLEGTALDVGAHIGGATIALALNNPGLRVVAVEAVPPNVVLLRENIARAGVADRVDVIHAAAGKGAKGATAVVSWGFGGNVAADHHTFVGNAVMPEADLRAGFAEVVPVVTLASLVTTYGPLSFAKVDCEGCEYQFLTGKALASVDEIRGEEHHGSLKLDGFTVTYTQDNAPRGFAAVRDA